MGETVLDRRRWSTAGILATSLVAVFTVFFAFFPAGLVLYWVVQNLLSIAQQWMITRQVEAGVKK